MSCYSRGKKFEEIVRKALEKIPGVSIDRFYDSTSGFSGVHTISDFVVYKQPVQIYLECKVVTGNTLNFSSRISNGQWDGLLKKSMIPGVTAGILVWFLDHDYTAFIPIQELQRLSKVEKQLSLNIKSLKDFSVKHKKITARKKRTLFDYDFTDFISWVEE